MHAHYLSVMLDLLADGGLNAEDLKVDPALTLNQKENLAGIDARQFDAVCSRALALSGDPQFGLRVGSRINLPSQGIFGFALMSCATIGDALKLLVRYSKVISPSIRTELSIVDSGAELVIQTNQLTPSLGKFYTEVLFAGAIKSGQMLVGEHVVNPDVELDYSPGSEHELYEQTLGQAIRFNSNRRALYFDDARLATEISTANPITGDIFRRECERLFSPDSERGTLSERVQQVLIQSGVEFPTCAQMATRLHMSESTLQRRLANEGWRYQNLLDLVRYRLATEYLLGTHLPVSEIAYLLGFSDSTNFRRSFKRWSKTTPAQLRSNAKK